MTIQKDIYLVSGIEEKQKWMYNVYINKLGKIGKGGFDISSIPDKLNIFKKRIRYLDRQWCYFNIPSTIMWSGVDIHHDWENGGRMYILDKKIHRRMKK